MTNTILTTGYIFWCKHAIWLGYVSLLYCDIVVYSMPMRILLSVELVILVVAVDFKKRTQKCLKSPHVLIICFNSLTY